MVIYTFAKDFGLCLTGSDIDPFERHFHKSIPIVSIVAWIYETYANNPGDIDCLAICAHGWPGIVSIGQQFGLHTAHLFSPLCGAFAQNGRGIEIHACYVASSTNPEGNNGTADASGWGYDMMYKLAQTTATKVTAPIDYIWGIHSGSSYTGYRTMTVTPDGAASFREN
ncbi:MAG: hypothetical protein ABI878_16295 [Acidobacteriota bacterium]